MASKRIQRKRIKGWRMPETAVYVGRPSKWGNPYKAGETMTQYPDGKAMPVPITMASAADAVQAYRHWMTSNPNSPIDDIEELRGKDLACWCPLGRPCHADVLLELLNKLEEE